MLLSVGTILGCLMLPPLRRIARDAERRSRCTSPSCSWRSRSASATSSICHDALAPFLAVLFFLGIGGANFAMYTLWLPEQYATDCRASAFAFATSVGRFAGAGITFLVGAGVQYFQTLGTPVALTSIAFLIGLLALPFGEETTGKPLPR